MEQIEIEYPQTVEAVCTHGTFNLINGEYFNIAQERINNT